VAKGAEPIADSRPDKLKDSAYRKELSQLHVELVNLQE